MVGIVYMGTVFGTWSKESGATDKAFVGEHTVGRTAAGMWDEFVDEAGVVVFLIVDIYSEVVYTAAADNNLDFGPCCSSTEKVVTSCDILL